MRVRQFRYRCTKCNRTITVPGKVSVCPVCQSKLEAEPSEIKTERKTEPLKWDR